ncbi:MAG: hypothetical protein AAF806_03655 [Bacteroidota bacterium]
MSNYQIVKTLPSVSDFHVFSHLPKQLYSPHSQRFLLDNDPSEQHLEGCYVLLENNKAIGRFAFYENPNLQYQGKAVACIGSYECVENQEVSKQLLQYAFQLAKEKDYAWLLGPMEGSTWNNYRFSLHNNQPNFFLEPYHHVYYNQQFQTAGFQPIARYVSNLDEKLDIDESRLQKLETHFQKEGIIVRNIDLKKIEEELYRIGQFSIKAFADNFLYTPIAPEDFVAKYSKVKSLFQQELIWIVENKQQEIQAISFSIKDHWDAKGETVIIKSLARKKGSSLRGLGAYLIAKTYQTVKSLGYQKVIHAMMIQDNASVNLSEKYSGDAYKEYVLYGKKMV